LFLLFSTTVNAEDVSPQSNSGKDIIRIASVYRTLTLDPIKSIWTGSIETFGQLYSRLFRRGDNGELLPGLAERWEMSDDGLQYTFYLRSAHFSDGSAITAHDVAFSLLRMRDHPEAAYSAAVTDIANISVLDARTVQIQLHQPAAAFILGLEMCFLGIVSKADVEKRGDVQAFAADPVTSGPYRVVQWKHNDRIILEPNPHYWREGYPLNDGAELIEVVDSNTRASMLLTGEIDAIRAVSWAEAARLKSSGLINIPHEPAILIWMILLNHGRPPFDDIRVRQAAVLAIDRKLITKVVTHGNAVVANTTIPKLLNFHHSEFDPWPFDIERAKQLMREANIGDHEVLINIVAPDPPTELIALVLQSQWQKIGLKTRIEKVDQALDEQRLETGEYDASINWWYNENEDPDQAVRWAVCGSCGNRSYFTEYQNDEVDRLVAEGSRTMDEDERQEIYHRIQEISTTEVAQIPLFYPTWQNGYSKKIEGLRLTPATQWTLENARHVE
jgi:peptide/nickel transport system substrate-binding protein